MLSVLHFGPSCSGNDPRPPSVEGLYCKRPIQCLARVCIPPPPLWCGGGGHTRWKERGVGVNILEDARHCSVLYIHKYFVPRRIWVCDTCLSFWTKGPEESARIINWQQKNTGKIPQNVPLNSAPRGPGCYSGWSLICLKCVAEGSRQN
jgi:hypothetical protein